MFVGGVGSDCICHAVAFKHIPVMFDLYLDGLVFPHQVNPSITSSGMDELYL